MAYKSRGLSLRSNERAESYTLLNPDMQWEWWEHHESYTCNPNNLEWEGFIDFLQSHTNDTDQSFQLERQGLLRVIPETLKTSSEAVQKYMPGKNSTGLAECRFALAEVRAHRLSLTTHPGIAYAASHDRHECKSSCDRILCDVNSIILKIDTLALRSARFVDTHFWRKDCPSRSDNFSSIIYVTIPDADDAGEWIRLTDDSEDRCTRGERQGFHKSGAARLASTLMCRIRPDTRYPQQDGENIWAALKGVTESVRPDDLPWPRNYDLLELQSFCKDATDFIERPERSDLEILKNKWSVVLLEAEKYVKSVEQCLRLRPHYWPVPPPHRWTRDKYRGRGLDTEETPLPGSWRALCRAQT